MSKRIASSVRHAFKRIERHADPVLSQLLLIERQRCAALLESVVTVDRDRDTFVIDSVESDVRLSLGGAAFRLRCDRIDRCDNGALIVIDYKTGQHRRFLVSGEPADLQLVLYACAIDAEIAGLALFNVDTRRTVIDGVGPLFGAADEWQQCLDGWKETVRATAAMIAAGDVRLNVRQSSRDARPLDVLSRHAELRRGA